MKKILILAGRYLPGYKDGGPVRTLINLTDLLGDEYEFRLAVLDRDHGDTEQYPNVQVNAWNEVGKAKVWYYRQGEMNFSLIKQLAKEVDLIYCCGFYDGYGYKTLILNRLGKLKKPVVVASMGSFTEGALSQKTFKKKTFIRLCKLFGLFKNITWSVTSEMELADLRRVIGKKANCIIAEDLPRSVIVGKAGKPSPKGELTVAFVARLHRHKNLLRLIEELSHVSGKVHLTVGGPIADEEYWQECLAALNSLPEDKSWEYVGEIFSEEIPAFFSTQDVMALPTLGENYCHVVYEALSSGCVPVISDRTPWNWICADGCGFTVPLEEEGGFARVLQALVDMTEGEKVALVDRAVAAARKKLQESTQTTGYRKIFG